MHGALPPTTRPTPARRFGAPRLPSHLRPHPRPPQVQPSSTSQAEGEHPARRPETNLHNHRNTKVNTVAVPPRRYPRNCSSTPPPQLPSRRRGSQHPSAPAAAARRSAATAYARAPPLSDADAGRQIHCGRPRHRPKCPPTERGKEQHRNHARGRRPGLPAPARGSAAGAQPQLGVKLRPGPKTHATRRGGPAAAVHRAGFARRHHPAAAGEPGRSGSWGGGG